ncbi:MAG: nucleoside-diphosphate sugar epimerase [Chlorobi bacterium OLB7]|nr:MAG: nucleoside-diphosphate sugar epimerase [Chlorobi bacterium OLB7]
MLPGPLPQKSRRFFAGNQLATRNLLEAALRHTPNLQRFLHVSSLAAVGPAPDLHHPVDETTPFHPITTYGESKAAAEREVFDRMSKLPATIVRPPVVYGPRDAGTGAFTFLRWRQKGWLR